MFFCDNCGSQIVENHKFCPRCGQKINNQRKAGLLIFLSLLVFFFIFIIISPSLKTKDAPKTKQELKIEKTTEVYQSIFYTKNNTNIRECASLDCDILTTISQNTAVFSNTESIAQLLEWNEVQVKTGLGENLSGYAHKSTLSSSPVSTTSFESKINTINKNNSSLPLVVEKWEPAIVYIECGDYYGESISGGTGLLSESSSGNYVILTNKHIVEPNGYGGVYSCRIRFSDSSVIFIPNSDINIAFGNDWASMNTPIAKEKASVMAAKLSERCVDVPKLGESIITLGYPAIGSTSGITVTEGIISGYEENYYLTSAKIDQGNSGGAAILVEKNCYLGIPSYAIVGEIESLGRILKASVIY